MTVEQKQILQQVHPIHNGICQSVHTGRQFLMLSVYCLSIYSIMSNTEFDTDTDKLSIPSCYGLLPCAPPSSPNPFFLSFLDLPSCSLSLPLSSSSTQMLLIVTIKSLSCPFALNIATDSSDKSNLMTSYFVKIQCTHACLCKHGCIHVSVQKFIWRTSYYKITPVEPDIITRLS